jgi:hypothetical protein
MSAIDDHAYLDTRLATVPHPGLKTPFLTFPITGLRAVRRSRSRPRKTKSRLIATARIAVSLWQQRIWKCDAWETRAVVSNCLGTNLRCPVMCILANTPNAAVCHTGA